MFVLNIAAILLLFFSYLAAYVSPAGNFWWLQFFSLTYGILLSANIFFILFWLFVERKKAWYSLIAIIFGANRILAIYQPAFAQPELSVPKNSSYHIKVMSFNVHLFDLYNWSGRHEHRDKILDYLKRESPDVVCFQEYFTSDGLQKGFRMNDTLKSILAADYSHIAYTTTLHDNKDHWGIATFSKYPIVNKKTVHFRKNRKNAFIYSDITVGTDTLRVINTHLESIRFKPEDYKFMQNPGESEEELSSGLNILRKLKRAYTKRSQQVNVLKSEMIKSPYPVIVCGDFNDTPSSYAYHNLSEGLSDAFRESGKGFGKTYGGSLPSYRIDYILHDKKLKSIGFITSNKKLSDHYPISCLVYKE
jgi:endonuclease/exonuclease/phosphatase family metal-dependent hydrolase